MLNYLVILLDDTCPSFCHYTVPAKKQRLISQDNLYQGVLFAMKENLTIQFVYPEYDIPTSYINLINTIDHIDLVPWSQQHDGQVILFPSLDSATGTPDEKLGNIVVRLRLDDIISRTDDIIALSKITDRINLIIGDIDSFNDALAGPYESSLMKIEQYLLDPLANRQTAQINLITDRLNLDQHNNCDAGLMWITLAPDGRFYPCPAFYYAGKGDIGSPEEGVGLKNKYLLDRKNAPICRRCDAYHCKRCFWMNLSLTGDINTPSRQQCIMAHIERRVSRQLQVDLKQITGQDVDIIPELEYLDPFELINK